MFDDGLAAVIFFVGVLRVRLRITIFFGKSTRTSFLSSFRGAFSRLVGLTFFFHVGLLRPGAGIYT